MGRGKVMVTFKRLLLWFTFGVGLLTYPLIAGRIDSKERMIFIGFILLLGIFLTGTGGGRKVKRIRRRSKEDEELKEDESDEIPAPVQSEEDASTRRNEKLSRSRGGASSEPEQEPEAEEVTVSLAEDTVSVDVIEENVHVAEEFVAEVDAESMEEADIEGFIDERRDRHDLIRRRIEARRREQLADIRADAAKTYQSADESEDLITLLGSEGHGLTVLETSIDSEEGSPIGAVFVRIDSERILKVRMPLDQGFIEGKEPLPELPPLPDLGDLPLPPLPDLGDLPLPPLPDLADLPPPPLPAPSKLDTLREEMSNDD